jgi:uncharacterized protein (TIGR03437 family)
MQIFGSIPRGCKAFMSGIGLAFPLFLLTAFPAKAQTLVVTPTGLAFTYTADSTTLPAPQTIQITSPNGSVPFLVTVSAGNLGQDPTYVSVNPATGTTPATVTVTVASAILTYGYGQYVNTVGVGLSPYTPGEAAISIGVALNVNLPPPPTVASILNASSLQPGFSPGAVVTTFGEHIGPEIPAVGEVYASGSDFYYDSNLGDSKVTFNGYASPLLFTNAGQINAVVPYEVAGQANVQMVVAHDFVVAPAITVPIQETSPGIFTDTENGSGQGAILNQNGGLNGTQNPAAVGPIIQVFGAGAGLWNPPATDGIMVSPIAPFAVPVASVSVAIGGQPAELTYAGAAPGLISGIPQVNAIVPAGLASGPQPIVLTVGKYSNSQQHVTVVVQ